ncbi:MAG: hypothetical protein ACLFS3_00725 [Candidatus Aenigmatarchaeota archaeon]
MSKELDDSEKVKGKENLKLNIIADMVQNGEIDPGNVKFTTWQDKRNDDDEIIGTVRVVMEEDDELAQVEYICPRCQHHGFKKTEYKRPFWVECKNCEKSFTVPKLKGKVERNKKGPKP